MKGRAARGGRPPGALPATGAGDGGPAAVREGLVVAAHGRHCIVEPPDGQRLLCHVRGKKSTLVVGDRVAWAPSGDEGVVEQLLPRRNLLYRQDEWKTKSFAANLDQLLVLVAVEPMYAESQLSRALIAADQAGIPVLLVLNKIDLPGAEAARARLAPYRAMGIAVLELSLKARGDESAALLQPHLHGRATLVLGPSGMGKSTLINRMVPHAEAQVGEISQALNTGRHTTTDTRWYWLDEGGAQATGTTGDAGAGLDGVDGGGREDTGQGPGRSALIDSPGFQAFGLRQVAAADLAGHMPDLRAALGHCRFHNCSHLHEPGCGVREAVAAGRISPSRYRIYGELHEELSATRW